VEKVVSAPTMFRATPIREGLSILMGRRVQETAELQSKTRGLLRDFMKEKAAETALQEEEEEQFIMVPGKEALIRRREKLIENVQKSLDVVVSWKRFPQRMARYAEWYKKALKKGARIRMIVDKPRDTKLPAEVRELVKDFKKYPSFGLRYVLTPPPAVISIYDKKEALVSISAVVGFAESPALWLDNPSFLAIIQDYFELMWLTAIEEVHKES
jgi:sugar-specific transcriptional regulator TrmB